MESDIRAKAPAGLPGASGFPAAPGPFPEIPGREAEAPVSGVHTGAGEHTGLARVRGKTCLVALRPQHPGATGKQNCEPLSATRAPARAHLPEAPPEQVHALLCPVRTAPVPRWARGPATPALMSPKGYLCASLTLQCSLPAAFRAHHQPVTHNLQLTAPAGREGGSPASPLNAPPAMPQHTGLFLGLWHN